MPSFAVARCGRCGLTSEQPIARGPIPVISACSCGGQRQIVRILFRPREQPVAGNAHRGGREHPKPAF